MYFASTGHYNPRHITPTSIFIFVVFIIILQLIHSSAFIKSILHLVLFKCHSSLYSNYYPYLYCFYHNIFVSMFFSLTQVPVTSNNVHVLSRKVFVFILIFCLVCFSVIIKPLLHLIITSNFFSNFFISSQKITQFRFQESKILLPLSTLFYLSISADMIFSPPQVYIASGGL